MDQMVGGIFYEHTHRMIASVIGFLTVVAAFWLWKREERKWVRILGLIALGAVIAQGVLGGLTVLFLLPTAISVSHAALAQSFFCIMAALALVTSAWWRAPKPTLEEPSHGLSIVKLSLLSAGLVYIQLILGALMRHTNSGLAVPDFPLAYGQIIPSLTPEALAGYNDILIRSEIRIFADGPVTASQVLIHMLHRLGAVLVSISVIWTSARLFKLSSVSKRMSRFGYLLLGILLLQISLGALTVLSRKPVDITTAHVATGALLLVTSVVLCFHAVKVFGWPSRRHVFSLSSQEAAA